MFIVHYQSMNNKMFCACKNRYRGVQTVYANESLKSKLKVDIRVCKIILWPWTRAVRILPADPTQIQLSVRISPQLCIKFRKACVGLLPSTLWRREPKTLPVFLSSQHFVPLANVTALKGAEKTREIYTVNHFCAETAEEGLVLAGKHRRLCAVAAKKTNLHVSPALCIHCSSAVIRLPPPWLVLEEVPRRLWSLMLYLTGQNQTL